jgi:cell division protein FtsA
MDTRIGYPNEHLAGNSDEEISSPLYATAVGLVMNSIENKTQSAVKMEVVEAPKAVVYRAPVVLNEEAVETRDEVEQVAQGYGKKEESTETKIRRSFFDRYVDKIKDFLDNAE